MITELIKFLDKQFGRASMLAKLSLVFNIALTYAVIVFYENDGKMKQELIKAYSDRYLEQKELTLKLGILKNSTDHSTTQEIKEDIDAISKQNQKK